MEALYVLGTYIKITFKLSLSEIIKYFHSRLAIMLFSTQDCLNVKEAVILNGTDLNEGTAV